MAQASTADTNATADEPVAMRHYGFLVVSNENGG